MSIAGNVRLSATLRSRMISELPVPLNSSKITSSMRLPVSINAVAMMVSEPPSSMLRRAAPKKRGEADVGERDRVAVAIAAGGGVFQVRFERVERSGALMPAPFDAGR